MTPWLAERILEPHKTGDRVAWLTNGKAFRRFVGSLFRKRQVLGDSDLAAG